MVYHDSDKHYLMVPPNKAAAPAPSNLPAVKPVENERLAKIVIVALALLLRAYGLGWALPTASRYYSYHVDESMVASAALSLNPFLLKLDPGFYNYGSLSLLLDSILMQIGSALHLVGAGPIAGIPSAGALLCARLITVGLGTATCLLIYATARRLYGSTAAIIAGVLYAIAPLAVQHGHWATVDVPATFWIAGSLFFAVRAGTTDARKLDFLWCGIWAGLAAATKYNAGIVLLSGFAALYFNRRAWIHNAAFLVIGSLAALLLGSPAILLNPKGVRDAIVFESGHTRTGHGDVFTGTLPGFLYHIVVSLNWGLSIPLLALVLFAVAFIAWKRRPGDMILLAFAMPYYLLIGLAQVKFARYTLPLLPPLFLFTGTLVEHFAASKTKALRSVTYVVFGIAAASAFVLTIAFDRVMTLPDTRDQAADFIRSESLHSVGFATGPWYFSPTLNPFLASPIPRVAQKSAMLSTDIRLIACEKSEDNLTVGRTPEGVRPVEWDYDLIDAGDPDAVAVSEYEYGDALRIHRSDAAKFLDAVEKKYRTRHVFSQPLEVFGMPLANLTADGDLPSQGLPHDMKYTNPITVVFTK